MSNNALLQLGPPTKMCRVDIGGSIITASVHEDGDRVILPVAATFGDGDSMQAMIIVSKRKFEQAVRFAESRGMTALRLADLAQKLMGHRPLITLEERPLFER